MNVSILNQESTDIFPVNMFIIVKAIPVLFLEITVIINLNNWAFYYIKIGEMAVINGRMKKGL